MLQQEINALTGADYRSSEGVRNIQLRQRVRAGDGKVYEYMGVDGAATSPTRRSTRTSRCGSRCSARR